MASSNGVPNGTKLRNPIMPIAVIGMSARLPGEATDPEKLYKMCSEARDAWSTVPPNRFNQAAFYHPDANRNGTSNVKGAHFLEEDLALFDAPFFGMTRAEAAALDPQQRLLLESCYEMFENAGIRLEDVVGSDTAVFVGSFCKDWGEVTLRDPDATPMYQATGSGQAMLSNRLSYYFNLTGPSVTMDTACSASLVALHLAAQSIKAGECKQALVGGVNVMLNHDMMITMSSMRFLSPDGRSYTYDSRANGYARGEGVACLLLKPLEDAIRDNDCIRAVIRNTGINQDGKTNGITLPSSHAQAELIRKTYLAAGLDPLCTTYVEAHGTGTQAGDPLEAAALSKIFCADRTEPLAVGSVKTNIGHLEGASGVAGLVKTVLMLEKGEILPNAHFKEPNDRIPLDEWKLDVPTSLRKWKGNIHRASINSFGYGGTNAHIIIEQAQEYLQAYTLKGQVRSTSVQQLSEKNGTTNGHSTSGSKRRLFTLSAFDKSSGKQQAQALREYLARPDISENTALLEELEYTLNYRRSVFGWKHALHASSREELNVALESEPTYVQSSRSVTVAFCFTGQGAQWFAMGRELIHAYPVFQQSFSECAKHITEFGAEWSLIDEISKDAEQSRVNEASISQPCCTAIQIALTDLLKSWGVQPTAVIGHSSGEIAAAYATKVLSRADAMAASFFRGKFAGMIEPGKGSMAAVTASEFDTNAMIADLKQGKASIACFNSPNSMTVSGDLAAINELVQVCKARDIFARKLVVDVAYHSVHMHAVADKYREAIEHIQPQAAGSVAFYSSVTGQLIESPKALGSDYWIQNLVSPVRFSEALSTMFTAKAGGRRLGQGKKPPNVILELGPHSALAGPIKQTLSNQKYSYFSVLIRNKDAVETAMSLAARLYETGHPTLNFTEINRTSDRKDAHILVDLPCYPFNHSVAYWAEPRESIQYRQRKWPRHDLLGAPVRMPNPLEPRWRNWIRTSELPWACDHKVQGLVIYPAAGYLAMAIEAAHQKAITAGATAISGYEMREISIGQAMIIPDDSGEVESMLTMRPYAESSRTTSDVWDEFRISSAGDGGTWTEHCRGLITVKLKQPSSEVYDSAKEDESFYAQERDMILKSCVQPVDVSKMYENCSKVGLDYGPTFANLTSAKRISGKSHGTIKISDIASVMPAEYHSPHVVHPSTLDACFHACFPAQDSLESPIVPTFIANVFVSHSITKTAGDELSIYMKIDKKSHRDTISSETVYEQGVALPVISITGLTTTSLAANESQDALKNVKKTYFQTAWAPEPSLLTSQQLSGMCDFLGPGPEEAALCRLFDEMGYYIAERALSKVPGDFVPKMQLHNQKLYQSVKRLQGDVRNGRLSFDVSSWLATTDEQRDAVWEQVRKSGDEGRFVALVGDNLHRILLEEVDPLSVTMQDDALGKYYANNSRMARQYQQSAAYVDLLGHKNPQMRILEIGSGTGGATLPLLEALGGGKDGSLPRFVSYDVTDISTGFFEKVQEKVGDWKDLIHYRKLDIEQDPADQGLEVGTYDLIIAANVLHATKSMERTMTHVRKLLKPGGKLILTELMKKNGGIANLFGIFPGWWVGEEEERQEGALLTEEAWDVVLRKTGFGGIELSIWDTPDQMTHQGSNIITTAVEAAVTTANGVSNGTSEADILIISETSDETALAGLRNKIPGNPEVYSLPGIDPKGKTCIVLTELESPLLTHPTEEQFEALKKLMVESAGILWVTRGAAIEGAKPDLNMMSGLMRTLRLELGGNTLITLDLDAGKAEQVSGLSDTDIDTIGRVFRANFAPGIHLSNAELEIEYAERGGVIMVGRIVADTATTLDVASRIHNLEPAPDTIIQPGRPLKLEIETPGLLDSLYWDDDKRIAGEPQGDEVDIEVKATAVNFRDVMMAMGQIETHALGCECSGVVTKIGPAVRDLKVGDRVITHADGSFSNFVRGRQAAGGIVHMPDDMDFETAATLPIVYCTALHAIKVANLQKGETVLIHAASGGLGQALIMLCQHFGADIYATVGTKEKKQFLMDRFQIPESRIFSSRDASFAKGIMRRTDGKGIDVVMNSLSSDLLRVTWQCIASFGRFIELGKRDFAVNGRLEMAPFARNVSYIAVDLVTFLEERPEHGKWIWNEVMELVRGEHVHAPQPISIYAMADVEKALRTMQSGKHMGKLVLVPTEEGRAKVTPRPLPPAKLRADATYLLAGGMGGIGRALAIWMVKHGAKNIAFTSRSGLTQPNAKEIKAHLESLGAKVKVLACDISSASALRAALDNIAHDMPPIKGVMQLALVIKNALFANTTLHETWAPSLKPKIAGTWNLHNLLPKDMDFFILYSSMVGVFGNEGQAAYGAASAFQDAFANHRNAVGLPATCIDLGMVTGVGYVAERTDLQRNLQERGFEGISEDECMAIIESAIMAPKRDAGLDAAIMTGVGLVDFAKGGSSSTRPFYHTPKFSHFRRMAFSSSSSSSNDESGTAAKVRDLLKAATDFAEAIQVIVDAVLRKIGSLLMVPAEDLSAARAMADYGMDSLVAVEMRNWITRDLEVTVPILELLGSVSINDLCKNIAKQSKLVLKKEEVE